MKIIALVIGGVLGFAGLLLLFVLRLFAWACGAVTGLLLLFALFCLIGRNYEAMRTALDYATLGFAAVLIAVALPMSFYKRPLP